MSIEIKISKKPIEYNKAINYLEKRVKSIKKIMGMNYYGY